MALDTIIYTGLVGLGLLGCGYILGIRFFQARIEAALRRFIGELIDNKVVSEKKLNAYIIKVYGPQENRRNDK